MRREVLGPRKKDDELSHLPVVILTPSDADDDILKSYKRYAPCYLTQPLDLDPFLQVVGAISG